MNRLSLSTPAGKQSRTGLNGINLESAVLALIVVVALCGLYLGWKLFWYLTDDAFIAFRYVSNSILGYGYVWNPPPFKPVEGYTSFLWVLVLDVVWRIFGVMPPDSANWISLGFSYLTLALSMIMFYRFDWNPRLKKFRIWFLILFLGAVLANRTFLAWTSSGLETAMFNFFLIYWVYSSFCLNPASRNWMWSISVSTSLVYLTRPDGLLFSAATLLMVATVLFLKWREGRFLRGDLLSLLPMTVIPLHLFWRFQMYGEWLPNTYHAKASAGLFWATSGTYYFLAFVIEYSLWFYFALVLMFLGRTINHWRRTGKNLKPSVFEASNLIKLASLSVLLVHFIYYTFVIGGDHFEFRVYSHFIILVFLSTAWMLNRMTASPTLALTFYAIFVLASFPIPWMHWYYTQHITVREEAVGMAISLADEVQQSAPSTPGFVLSYLSLYDHLQSWLAHHFVCVRHQEHKVFWQSLIDEYPSREEGSLIPGDGFPVVERRSVGVLAWVLPHVNVIDKWGLNDYVIARNPDLFPGMLMAHLRQPPDGYVECFEPNVVMTNKMATLADRPEQMTVERIENCEAQYIQSIESGFQR